jgi:hypothetical protein
MSLCLCARSAVCSHLFSVPVGTNLIEWVLVNGRCRAKAKSSYCPRVYVCNPYSSCNKLAARTAQHVFSEKQYLPYVKRSEWRRNSQIRAGY